MKPLPRPTRLARLFGRRSGAFSLPETTIAVAIAALGIVSVMGLMPQGLETSRKIGNLAAQTRIMQNIIGDLESTDWSLLDNYVTTSPNRSYDDQGVLLSSAGTDSRLTSYVAHIEFENPGSILPESAGGGTSEPYLRRLNVKIANTSSTTYDFGTGNASRYKTLGYLLTKIQ
jgi:uncharacterized protein (TIGR02598 family)